MKVVALAEEGDLVEEVARVVAEAQGAGPEDLVEEADPVVVARGSVGEVAQVVGVEVRAEGPEEDLEGEADPEGEVV